MKTAFKYFIVLLLSMLTYYSVFSQNVSRHIAVEAAINHYRTLYNINPEIDNVKTSSVNDTVCYYLINYRDSGWCVISSDYSIEPILAFGKSKLDDDDTVSAFEQMLQWYSFQIISWKRSESLRNEHPHWSQLLTSPISAREIEYDYGLLDKTGRGNNLWGQYGNNNNTIFEYNNECTPSYNDDCPQDSWYNTSCHCGHKLVGCGAVAIGQVMWYWKWPKDINWEMIPARLTINTPTNNARALTDYLHNCGIDVGMHYMCKGSWSLMDDIFDALQDKGYLGIKKYEMSEWFIDKSWESLIKSEIQNRRPVIMYGESFTFTTGHYFVIDDYYSNNYETWFHVNWGHRRTANGFFKIDRLHDGKDYYDIGNKAIVGISPTYNETDINSLPYNVISAYECRTEYAYRNIIIPGVNGLTILPEGNFNAESGGEIVLRPGFKAMMGSSVNIRINEKWLSQMAISVPIWPTVYDPANDGLYRIKVYNADSWEFTLSNLNSDIIHQDAGTIDDTMALLWDGTINHSMSYGPYGLYQCTVAFKNSFGRRVENSFMLLLEPHNYTNIRSDTLGSRLLPSQFELSSYAEDNKLIVFPNPSTGIVNFEVTSDTISRIMIYDELGRCRYLDYNIENVCYRASLYGFPRATYYAVIIGKKASYYRKIVLN